MKRLLLPLLALILAGCGAAPAAPAASQAVPSAAPTAQARGLIDAPIHAAITQPEDTTQVLVEYRRSGGMTGRTIAYSIRADGSVVVEGSALVRGAAEQILAAPPGQDIAAFSAQLAATNIATLGDADFSTASTCCDLTFYELRVILDGQAHSFTTASAANTPQALDDALSLVQQYIEAAQAAS